MSTFLSRSAVCLASAALFAMAVVPALAQPEETQPPAEMQTETPPAETGGNQMRSEPNYAKETPEGMRLRNQQMAGAARCRSGADTEAEAVEDCKAKLNCQPPTPTVKCSYRSNNQDWICRCV